MAKIKFIDLFDRKISHVIHQAEFLVGRGKDCALRIEDPEVSRHQARVGFDDRSYGITNLGKNPLRINGQAAASQRLEDGDLMQVGNSRFLIRILEAEDFSAHRFQGDVRPGQGESPASLTLTTGPGKGKSYPLSGHRLLIGRCEQAGIRLTEKNISRRHCIVETEENSHVITRLSRSCPLSVNDRDVDRRVLENNDRIRIGDHVFIFRRRPEKTASAESADATQFAGNEAARERPPHLLVESASGQARVFNLERNRSLIGREPESDLQLAGKTVSRKHARIEASEGAYWIENLSRSAGLEMNGKPVERGRLYGGDQIRVGTHTLVFVSARPEDQRPAKSHRPAKASPPATEPAAEHTVFADAQPIRPLAPRLILDTGADTARTFHLDQDRMIIGRSSDAQIHLDDPSVSRIHGAVEMEAGAFFATSLGAHNPIRVNREETRRQRIYAGDRIQVGNTILSFMSDREEDVRPAPAGASGPPRRPAPVMRTALICLILVLGGYLAYSQAYRPWKAGRFIEKASAAFNSGRFENGRKIIEAALGEPLSPEKATSARRMLAEATLNQARRLARAGRNPSAQKLLAAYLAKHGAEAHAALVWREQDRLRLQTGQALEKAGDRIGAMTHYASVRAESRHFAEAGKQLARLWLAAQVEGLTRTRLGEAVAVLAELGEKRFAARQYLVPAGRSAYGAFAAILALAPEQKKAREKIEAMGTYYSDQGRSRMGKKDWAEALERLELAAFIDPANGKIAGAMNLCRRKMGKIPRPAGRKSARIAKQAALEAQGLAAVQAETMVAGLLAAGRAGLESGNSLIPFGNNAYAAYQAALSLAPDNARAVEGIRTVQRRVRRLAEAAYAAENWPEAERLLGGYLLIDPIDTGIRDKLIVCQRKRMNRAGPPGRLVDSPPWIATYLKDS